jgi:hypothetical protein
MTTGRISELRAFEYSDLPGNFSRHQQIIGIQELDILAPRQQYASVAS